MKKKNIIRAIKGLWYRKYFVVMDGRVNSVTLSEALYKHIMRKEWKNTDIIVFDTNDTQQFAFAMRDEFETLKEAKTNFSSLQYNSDHHKIGFRSDSPSVNAILDQYGCPLDRLVRLSVIPRKTVRGETFYEIQKPF
jgi:hypothetical protein